MHTKYSIIKSDPCVPNDTYGITKVIELTEEEFDLITRMLNVTQSITFDMRECIPLRDKLMELKQ